MRQPCRDELLRYRELQVGGKTTSRDTAGWGQTRHALIAPKRTFSRTEPVTGADKRLDDGDQESRSWRDVLPEKSTPVQSRMWCYSAVLEPDIEMPLGDLHM